ncbi:FAD-binding oxidoreductase [Pseudooceanicola sp. CBS1P-1]|uniref:FAD-dependent oxidoreductase n=1 Tax=Pseudooceanicola albus TaxID=2692189 RepID=A0A6L7GA11_9RHOB|nr:MULTISPECIES: FAD-binding oxidoreductase [Pseudooceanicola]MBT9385986.1 FAD-binding oxidoreductase [Pseudooceanicola endophyticus]MXN19593.1 FAD-dependent oxidoreductase [Pseudooceanicola albus]
MLTDVVQTIPGQALPDSLYARTLPAPPPPRQPLGGPTSARVAIVGAGFTGLAAALQLARAGIDVVVLEANEPGWGASGRNGGQINPGLKSGPETVSRDLNAEMMKISQAAADTVFDLVAELGIECDIRRGGTLRAAPTAALVGDLEALTAEAARCGVSYRMLSAAEMAAATGSGRYAGGMIDPKGGQLNPLKYALGLAAAARAAGARIHGDTPVLKAEKTMNSWALTTPKGKVTADRVLFATNGYSGPLIPGLRRSLLPVFSSILASKPLPEELRKRILADGQSLFEISAVTTYYRVDAEGRLVFGGRGRMAEAGGPRAFPSLERHAEKLWPGIGKVGWDYGWNGRVALTADHYPHLHQIEQTGYVCLGYNGRGVAMATVMGLQMGALLAQPRTPAPVLPATPITPIAFQPFWPSGVAPTLAWKRLGEALRRA